MTSQSNFRDNKFSKLSLGSIKPSGWLKNQLEIQAAGLTGHIDEFWEDLGPDNKWLGGTKEGWERGPYYADGLIPLAYLLEDKKLVKKAKVWIESFLENKAEDGWVGPEESEEGRYENRDPWPVFIVLKTLTQYYEVSDDERVIEVMEGFFKYLSNNLEERPLFSWGKFRWADLVISIHWLYEKTEEEWLLKLAEVVAQQGYDWADHFSNFKYKKKSKEIKLESHVVNNAMGIKTPAVWYRQSGEDYQRAAVYQALNNLDKFHGQVTGVFTGDEHLSGKNPSQGTELCAVVEYMFSLETLLAVLGDIEFADRLERITFNALPATFKPDMWAHQYDQQVNQVICNVAERDWTNSPDANIYGLEPNFGCCTANMHQGWPKFVSSLWMSSQDKGLSALAYSPCRVTATVGDAEQEITIIEETNYPFNDTINFKIEGNNTVTFPLYLRIPTWAKGASVKLLDGDVEEVESGSYYMISREWHPGDYIQLKLPMELRTERRYHGSLSILRGPLVYSLKIDEEWKLIDGCPPHGDWEVYPQANWNYALWVDQENPADTVKLKEKSVGDRPFSPEDSPVELKVRGRLLPQWKLEDNWAGAIPASPVKSNEELEDLILIPYGASNLRVTEFPLLEGEYMVIPKPGMIIKEDTVFKPGVYDFRDQDGLIIATDNITIDGNGAVLQGGFSSGKEFWGTGIKSEGYSEVRIKNLTVKGFNLGLDVKDGHNWVIENNDFSHNYTDPEFGWGDGPDFGALRLEKVYNSMIRNNKGYQVWNGLDLKNSNYNKFINNNFSHCTNVCLRMWNSSHNIIEDNDFSYGIRIKPDEVHARDSSSLLMESGSNKNKLIRNDFSHGGDGIFIRVLNGWNSINNYFEENDCSYANNNAVECWAPNNTYIRNKANYSSYGFWMGGSDHTVMIGNEVKYNGGYNGETPQNAPEAFGNAGVAVVNGCSSHFVMIGNDIQYNNGPGLAISYKEDYPAYHWIIQQNIIKNNKDDERGYKGHGIYLKDAHWLYIAGNDLSDNDGEVIFEDSNVQNLIRREAKIEDKSPVARATISEKIVEVGQEVIFDASNSSDPEDGALHFRWELGDGSVAEESIVKHCFATPGFYRISLTVDNGQLADLSYKNVFVIDEGEETGTEDKADNWLLISNDPAIQISNDYTHYVQGLSSLRISTEKGSRHRAIYPAGKGLNLDLSTKEYLTFFYKFENGLNFTHEDNKKPVIRLYTTEKDYLEFKPQKPYLEKIKTEIKENQYSWERLSFPLKVEPEHWTKKVVARPNLARINYIEIEFGPAASAESTLWIDALQFK